MENDLIKYENIIIDNNESDKFYEPFNKCVCSDKINELTNKIKFKELKNKIKYDELTNKLKFKTLKDKINFISLPDKYKFDLLPDKIKINLPNKIKLDIIPDNIDLCTDPTYKIITTLILLGIISFFIWFVVRKKYLDDKNQLDEIFISTPYS